jgi:hypothetical protein
VKPESANQYVSHVTRFLSENEFIAARQEVRSDRSRDIINGLFNASVTHSIALRFRCKIPCTYIIMSEALVQVHILFPPLHYYARAKAARAAIVLGYALSLRPQEYLNTGTPVALWKQAHSSLCFFWFLDDPTPYNVCDPTAYPPGQLPTDFTLFLDFNKNHQDGNAGPRSMSRAPVTASVCCLQILFEFLVEFPPSPASALLSGGDIFVSTKIIRQIFTMTAHVLHLDPLRLVPHSLRSAAISQMLAFDDFSDTDLKAQGRWKSLAGMEPYAHTSLAHSRRITPALYDAAANPIAVTRLTFSDPSKV